MPTANEHSGRSYFQNNYSTNKSELATLQIVFCTFICVFNLQLYQPTWFVKLILRNGVSNKFVIHAMDEVWERGYTHTNSFDTPLKTMSEACVWQAKGTLWLSGRNTRFFISTNTFLVKYTTKEIVCKMYFTLSLSKTEYLYVRNEVSSVKIASEMKHLLA